jgi:hypothetical protein
MQSRRRAAAVAAGRMRAATTSSSSSSSQGDSDTSGVSEMVQTWSWVVTWLHDRLWRVTIQQMSSAHVVLWGCITLTVAGSLCKM